MWAVRTFVYRHFAETTRPPTVDKTAAHFRVSAEDTADLYRDLHQRHALFLTPGTLSVRMANPFSAIPTPFRVHAHGKTYWANCAWDALGIPAALRYDGVVEAHCADCGSAMTLAVRDGELEGHGEVGHFLVPFHR
jgi:hypothetical protein